MNKKVYYAQKTDSNGYVHECVIIGGTGGVQICTGKVTTKRPASKQLNGNSSIYTGYDTNVATFANEFGSVPVVMVAPKGANYWLGDAMASTSAITRIDFYTNARFAQADNDNRLEVTFEYMAIGNAGSIPSGMTSYDAYPKYKSGEECIQIPYSSTAGIQICSGTFKTSGAVTISSQVNGKSNIYTLRTDVVADDFPCAFAGTPKLFASPSLPCRTWKKTSTFDHSYWFGTTSADTNGISVIKQRVFSNYNVKKVIYGRYIAIGTYNPSSSTGSWVDGSATYESDSDILPNNSSNVAYSLRVGGSSAGVQIAFGNFERTGSDVSKALNGESTIYNGYERDICGFNRSFDGSPSTIITPNYACRDSSDNYVHPYWFGDAVSSTIGIVNMDMYTNKSISSGHIYGKYISMGAYSAESDKLYKFLKEAQVCVDVKTVDNYNWNGTLYDDLPIAKVIMYEYWSKVSPDKENIHQPPAKTTSVPGWCSEFASVMAIRANIDEKYFPRAASTDDFQDALKTQYYTPEVIYNTTTKENELTGYFVNSNNERVTPEPGNLMFTAGQGAGHTCIVVNVNGSYVYTIEGNRGGDDNPMNNYPRGDRRRIKGSQETGHNEIIGLGRVDIKWDVEL